MSFIDSGVKNAPRFMARKLAKINKDKATQVYVGQSEIGSAYVPKKNEEGELIGWYGPLADGRPLVGQPVLIHGGHGTDWIRTSIVKDYCIINDVEGKDKIVLPKEFILEGLDLTTEKLEDGDLLIRTMNSVYVMYKLDHTDNSRLQTIN